MARTISVLLVIAVSIVVVPAFAADTIYKESRRPSFTILVPDGWTLEKTDQGVSLNHGKTSEIALGALAKAFEPSSYLDQAIPQIQAQAKNFRLIERGACIFGQQQGSYAMYSGIGPNGVASISKMVVMTNGQFSYVLATETRPDKYNDEEADLQRIQDSFTPEVLGAKVDKPENLDALHAAGVITDQEYTARKQGESIFRDPRQPGSFTVAVPAGWTALKTDTGVTLEKQPAGSGMAQVWIQPQVNNPPAAVIASLEKQWKDLRKSDGGEVRFAGQRGGYGVFTGVGTSGKPIIIKVVTTTDGKTTFSLIMMTDQDKYDAIKKDWDHIQQSFAIDATP
jgi:hypothetical protein